MTSGNEENLRQEAAGWFARMRGPGAETARADFDAWRVMPGRQEAYDRMIQGFEDSAILGHSRLSALRLRTSATRRGPPPAVWWTAAAAALIIAVGLGVSRTSLLEEPSPPGPVQRYASKAGEIRIVTIAPGVTATLDTDTVLTATGADNPRLVLERGRARIDTARPIEALAGKTRVRADLAAFDLRRDADDAVELSALRGAVEAQTQQGPLQRARTRLSPGQRLIQAGGRAASATATSIRDRDWPRGLLIFDDTPLGEVLGEANRYSARKIRLSDPKLARLQVSGGLKVTDPDGLARALAAALNLNVAAAPDGGLVLSRSAA